MSTEQDDNKADLGFAELLGDVKLISSDKITPKKPKPYPTPRQKNLDQEKVMELLAVGPIEDEDMQAGDILSYCVPGIQKQTFRKLKRGQYSVGAELDLHGTTRIEAQELLYDFVEDSRQRGIKCVRIIHGKGHGSTNKGPVIKPLVNKWLRKRDDVLAFYSARPVDGGTGAVYVLLKSAN